MPTSHHSRVKLACNLLNDSNRIREDYSHVNELAESIRTRGLIQPIVITADYVVIDGGSRLRAVRDVLKLPDVDVVFMETMDEADLRVLEVEANIRRRDFSWTERVLAVVRVHELQVARSVLTGTDRWTQKQTGELLGQSTGNVNNFITLASYIRRKDQEILKCDGPTSALKLLVGRKEREATQRLAALTFNPTATTSTDQLAILNTPPGRSGPVPTISDDDAFFSSSPVTNGSMPINITLPDVDEEPGSVGQGVGQPNPEGPTIPLRDMLLLGDCFEHMAIMEGGSVDHVITDIPYGIDMSMLSQDQGGIDTSTVAAEHTVEGNIELMSKLFPAVYRILKPHGFFVLFYDLAHHNRLYDLAVAAGFKVQRWPLIWIKTHACINQGAAYNFTKNYEVAMVCRMPGATLLNPQSSSFWMGGNDDTRTLLGHPFVKPLKLWSWIMNAVALKGQTIYDPFAGVGSSTLAAINEGFRPLTSEINEDHYNRQVLHVSNLYSNKIPGVKFA